MSNNKNNLFSLDGKVIVVTGAAGLLGKEHAKAIASHGASPILIDISNDAVSSLAESINHEFNVDASGFSVDITNEDAVKENVQLIKKIYGQIDGLVNNAANNPKVENNDIKNSSRLENFPLEIWQDDINVSLTGSFLCSKYYGYEISKNPNGGSIINISSDLGLIGPDQRLYAKKEKLSDDQDCKPVSYSVVKTGIIGLTRYLSTYWADKNVRCNAICPGGVENEQPDEFINSVSSRIPLGRMAYKDEYQSTLIWMLCDKSSYLNGAIVPVDGGRTAW